MSIPFSRDEGLVCYFVDVYVVHSEHAFVNAQILYKKNQYFLCLLYANGRAVANKSVNKEKE